MTNQLKQIEDAINTLPHIDYCAQGFSGECTCKKGEALTLIRDLWPFTINESLIKEITTTAFLAGFDAAKGENK